MVVLFLLLMIWRPFLLEAIGVYVANAAMGVLAIIAWNHFEDYQKGRLLSFLDPEADRMRTGYQAIQSRVAIGSGGWLGNLCSNQQGFVSSLQSRKTSTKVIKW